MSRFVIYPYKMGSSGAIALQRRLQEELSGVRVLRVRPDGRYVPRTDDFVVNWGNSTIPAWGIPNILNHPRRVAVASNKALFFSVVTDVVVPNTTSHAEALGWINDGNVIVARQALNASAGRGITLITHPEQMIQAPLYTKYIKKESEYRVHVMHGEIIDIQQKRHARGQTPVSYQIRSHNNGWIFTRSGIEPPPHVRHVALSAIAQLGLDFGAVDVIWNQRQQTAYVLEVNTAPGLEGTTVEKYMNNLIGLYGGNH